MKKLLIILFANCLALSIAAAADSSDGNIPQEPAQPSASVTGSNEPDTAFSQQQAVPERPTRGRRTRKKMKSAAAEQQAAKVRARARRYQTFETQLADEYKKHYQRLAILNRIRQLAEQEGLADIIKRADRLIKMENDRHMKKITHLHRKPVITAKPNLPQQDAGTAGEPNK